MKQLPISFACLLLLAASVRAQSAGAIYERVSPSLVAVQFTWVYELGRIDFVTTGIIVRDDGLILFPAQALAPRAPLPDSQLADFKIIIPGGDKDDEEIDAVFQGRDERTNLAFVLPRETGRSWKPIAFEDLSPRAGEALVSVGMLPKEAGYTRFVMQAHVAARLRGEVPAYLVSGGLASVGAVVFNPEGKAIGYVSAQQGQQPYLHVSSPDPRQQITTWAVTANPPVVFIPASEVLLSLSRPPTPDKPLTLPWVGLPGLTGLEKEVAEAFGLKDQPAMEIGDIVPGSPAEKAGLQVGWKIVRLNGQPLERGDAPEELPLIFARNLRRFDIGSDVTLSVLTDKDQPLKDVKVTLAERPKRQNEMRRYWAEDLGFSTRDLVFDDTYVRKQAADLKGVIVSLTKREGSAAAAGLVVEDVITSINGKPVERLDQFEDEYKSLRKSKPREPIVFVVLKPDGSTKTIKIEPPQ